MVDPKSEKQVPARKDVVERFIQAGCDKLRFEQNEALAFLERMCVQILGEQLLVPYDRHSGAATGLSRAAQLSQTLTLTRECQRFVDTCRRQGLQLRRRDFVPPSPAVLRLRDLNPVDRNLLREVGQRILRRMEMERELSELKAEGEKGHQSDTDASQIEQNANSPE